MSKQITRIVAAVVDTRHLTMYKADGSTIVLDQGDPRIRRIIDEATPQLIRQGWADVDLYQENSYNSFEEKSNGVVRFFRVAKDKLKNLFKSETVDPQVVGVVPSGSATAEQVIEKTTAAVDEILKHAVPVSSPEFHEGGIQKQAPITDKDGNTPGKHYDSKEPDTVVAVVDGKIIPGAEKIKSQIARAASLGSTVGVENFYKRLAKVIDKRAHSVEDLLKFLERGDMPIADDGSILIYKVLRKKTGSENTFVDCHTGSVPQKVGSYVCMDEKLVDPNRRNECSNGLHVARRGYISGFSGDVCVLAKLAPEDVIAVPQYDANKMRVCGYHILFKLTENQHMALRTNKPITNVDDGGVLLAKAMRGDHVARLEEVRIGGHMGSNITVKKLTGENQAPKLDQDLLKPVAALENNEAEALDAPVDPKQIAEEVSQLSRKDQAAKLYAAWEASPSPENLEALNAFKKSCKISWEKLGISDPNPKQDQKPDRVVKTKPVKVKKTVTKVTKSKAKPKKAPKAVEAKPPKTYSSMANEPVAAPVEAPPPLVAPETVKPLGGPKAQAELLITSFGTHPVDSPEARTIASKLVALKKSSKKSWEYLGVGPDLLGTIQDILD